MAKTKSTGRKCGFLGLQEIREAAQGNEAALSEEERVHLRQCPECQERVEAARKMHDALHGLLQRGELDASAVLTKKRRG